MEKRKIQVEIIVFKWIDDQPLFLLAKRSEKKGGFWQPITGGVEKGEEILDAAKRELFEETQITDYIQILQDVHYFEFNSDAGDHLKEYVFGFEVAADTEAKLSHEHTEMKWCNLQQALDLLKHDNNKIAFKKLNDLINR